MTEAQKEAAATAEVANENEKAAASGDATTDALTGADDAAKGTATDVNTVKHATLRESLKELKKAFEDAGLAIEDEILEIV